MVIDVHGGKEVGGGGNNNRCLLIVVDLVLRYFPPCVMNLVAHLVENQINSMKVIHSL